MVLAHPQLPPAVAQALAVPALEDAVLEVLDESVPLHPVEAIQVHAIWAELLKLAEMLNDNQMIVAAPETWRKALAVTGCMLATSAAACTGAGANSA